MLKNQGVSPSLGSSLQKGPGVASGTEGADDLLLSSQIVDELNSDFIPDTYAATGAEGHITYSLERVRVIDSHRTLHSSFNVQSEREEVRDDECEIAHECAAVFTVSEKVNADVRQIAPVGAPVLAAANESVSESRPKVPYSTVVDSTSSTGVRAAIDDVDVFIHDDARQVSKRPERQSTQTTHSARWPAAPAEPSLATQTRPTPVTKATVKRPEVPMSLSDELMGGVKHKQRQPGKSTSSSSGTVHAVNEYCLPPGPQTAGPDREYPAPGQRLPPTPLQPTQEADAFDAELESMYRRQAARPHRSSTDATASTFVYPRHPRPEELLYAGRSSVEHRSLKRSVARSQRTSTTISEARHLPTRYMAPPPTYVEPSAAQYSAAPLSIAPSLRSQRSGRSVASNGLRAVMVSGEVLAVVHQVTDALLQVTHQNRDDAVARERLLLQQQQLLQRDFIDKEMKNRELSWAEKQKLMEKELEEKQLQTEREIKEKQLLFEREQKAAEAAEREKQLLFEREKMEKQLQFEREQKAAETVEREKQLQFERKKTEKQLLFERKKVENQTQRGS